MPPSAWTVLKNSRHACGTRLTARIWAEDMKKYIIDVSGLYGRCEGGMMPDYQKIADMIMDMMAEYKEKYGVPQDEQTAMGLLSYVVLKDKTEREE